MTPGAEHGTTWLMMAGVLSTLVGVALQIALLVVTLTVVRRYRPRAVAPLATSFGIGLASVLLSTVAYPLLSVVMTRTGGVDEYMVVQSAMTVGFTVVHVVTGVLLVLGLFKLATPEPLDGSPPSP